MSVEPAPDLLAYLPSEIWDRILDTVAVADPLSALNLTSTCRQLHASFLGQKARYLAALELHGPLPPPHPRQLALDSVAHEAHLLSNSQWPFTPSSHTTARLPLQSCTASDQASDDSNPPSSVHLSGNRTYTISPDRRALLVTSLDPQHKVKDLTAIRSDHPLRAFYVDAPQQVALLHSAEPILLPSDHDGTPSRVYRNLLSPVSLATGKALSDRPLELWLAEHPSTVEVQLVADKILIAQRRRIDIYRWQPSSSVSVPSPHDRIAATASSSSSFTLLFRRQGSHLGGHSDFRSATLLNSECLFLLLFQERGVAVDWGSTLELWKLSSFAQPFLPTDSDECREGEGFANFDGGWSLQAEIRLPIHSAFVPGLDYVKVGCEPALLDRWKEQRRWNCLVVVCVSGYIWMAELQSFTDLFYPSSAVSIYSPNGPSYPVLEKEWVRAHMARCQVSATDRLSCPQDRVTVSGWRVVSIWSRNSAGQPASSSSSTSAQPQNRAAPIYVRFIDTNPHLASRFADRSITSRDTPVSAPTTGSATDVDTEEPPCHTIFWKDRYGTFVFDGYRLQGAGG